MIEEAARETIEDEIRFTARELFGAFGDLNPMLTEFVRQVRDRVNILYNARERGFIAKLFPQVYESRHSE
jgi:hypothetical protein